jgi:ribosome-binding factor A
MCCLVGYYAPETYDSAWGCFFQVQKRGHFEENALNRSIEEEFPPRFPANFAHMSSVRLEKISALLKKELAQIFRQHMNTSFGGVMITVTLVRVSPDLSMAKVYLSFFPTEKKNAAIENVNRLDQYVRKLLAQSVGKQIRKVPDLKFFVDDSLDYYEEIDRLLKK